MHLHLLFPAILLAVGFIVAIRLTRTHPPHSDLY